MVRRIVVLSVVAGTVGALAACNFVLGNLRDPAGEGEDGSASTGTSSGTEGGMPSSSSGTGSGSSGSSSGSPGTSSTSSGSSSGLPDAGADGAASLCDSFDASGLSAHAQIGFTTSPVALSLCGMTAAQLEQIGQGAYIVDTQAACGSCHSKSSDPTDYLSGGVAYPLAAAIGDQVIARNLTPDPSTGLKDTMAQYVQATRTGTDTLNGNSQLLFHPWPWQRWMSTNDLDAIDAYLRVIPAISNTIPVDMKPSLSVVPFPGVYNEGEVVRSLPDGAAPDPDDVLLGTAINPINVAPPTDPTQATLFGRGSYIVNAVGACSSCHTVAPRNSSTQALNTAAFLSGGQVYASGSLAPLVGTVRSTASNLVGQKYGFFNRPNISMQVFVDAMQQGVHAERADAGTPAPLAWPMPWRHLGKMGTDDLQAVYTYLQWIAQHAPTTGDQPTRPAARYCNTAADCRSGEHCSSEYVGQIAYECLPPCAVDADCDTCQTCNPPTGCLAPQPDSTCILSAVTWSPAGSW
jgi:hypothetical protein